MANEAKSSQSDRLALEERAVEALEEKNRLEQKRQTDEFYRNAYPKPKGWDRFKAWWNGPPTGAAGG
jgi:hypothetical protein